MSIGNGSGVRHWVEQAAMTWGVPMTAIHVMETETMVIFPGVWNHQTGPSFDAAHPTGGNDDGA